MESKVTPLHSSSDAAVLEPLPFEQTEQFQSVLSAAHEHLLNRIEDERIDVDS